MLQLKCNLYFQSPPTTPVSTAAGLSSSSSSGASSKSKLKKKKKVKLQRLIAVQW